LEDDLGDEAASMAVFAAGTTFSLSDPEATWAHCKPRVTNSDPAVVALSVEGEGVEPGWLWSTGSPYVVTVQALTSGTSAVTVWDECSGRKGAASLTVREANRIELHAAIAAAADDPSSGSLIPGTAQVIAGGMGVMGVRYFNDDQELLGRDLVTVEGDPELTLDVDVGSPAGIEESVQVTPSAPGFYVMTVRVGSSLGQEVGIHAIPVEDVVMLTPARAADVGGAGVFGAVAPLAFDADGQMVIGIDCSWSVDGEALEVPGPILAYALEPAVTSVAVASLGRLDQEFEIHGTSPEVISNDFVANCASVPRVSATGSLSIALAIAGLLRRRAGGVRTGIV
jgi:hypothetical protein